MATSLAAFLILIAQFAASSALAQTAEQPELVVQDGHSQIIHSVAFSPDGRFLASGSHDQTIKLWDARSGRLLRSVAQQSEGDSKPAWAVAFSPDGTLLASCTDDPTVRLWSVQSGALVRTFDSPDQTAISSVAFSPDGKRIAAGSGDNQLHMWDAASGKLLQTMRATKVFSLGGNRNTNFSHIAFSPDGRTIVSGGWNRTALLWSVSDGSLIRTFGNQDDAITALAFSPVGHTIASASACTPPLPCVSRVTLWNADDGSLVRNLDTTKGVTSLTFTPDGRALAIGEYRGGVALRDTASGEAIREFEDTGSRILDNGVDAHTSVHSVAMSPDGMTIVGGLDNARLVFWGASTGRILRIIQRHPNAVTAVAIDPLHDIVAAGMDDADVQLVDAATMQPICRLQDSANLLRASAAVDLPFAYLVFSPDKRTVASWKYVLDENRRTITEDSVRLWDATSGRLITTIALDEEMPQLAFSPDGKALAVDDGRGTIRFFDAASGRPLRSVRSHGREAGGGTYRLYGTMRLSLSPDGQTMAIVSPVDETIKLLDVTHDRLLRNLQTEANVLAFNGSGDLLASGGSDGVIKLWNPVSGELLRSFAAHPEPSRLFGVKGVGGLAFSPDGAILVSFRSKDPIIKFWDVLSGTLLNSVSVATRLQSVSVNRNGVVIATTSMNEDPNPQSEPSHVVKLLSLHGIPLATVIAFPSGDELVVTPEGAFDGTQAAWNDVNWRFRGSEVAPVEAFFGEFFHPGLLADILAGRHLNLPTGIAVKDRRQPEVRLAVAAASQLAPGCAIDSRRVDVSIDVAELPADGEHRTGSGVRDVRLFRNGSLVNIWHGDVELHSGRAVLPANVSISAGENRFTAYAFNHDNIKSEDAVLMVNGAESLARKGTAHVLAVGINEYANAQFNLDYAVADAAAFSRELHTRQSQLGAYERVEVALLTDGRATKASILDAISQIASTCGPEDTVIVYFAGHGTAHDDRFYLVPHDLGYAGSRTAWTDSGMLEILAHSISDRELEQAFERIDAGRLLLVIDACNSGQALEADDKRRGPMNSKGLAQLAYEKGMYILTAAQSYQAAKEPPRLGHGFLTYALIEEGLNGSKADQDPHDGEILVREWLKFATERVPRMQEEALGSRGATLSSVEGEEDVVDSHNKSVQRPRVFYRRELDAQPFIIARTTGGHAGK